MDKMSISPQGNPNGLVSDLHDNYPRISIVILNWNGVNDTIECLEAIKKIKYPNYNVIIVDNGSSGNDVDVLKQKYGDFIHIIANDRNYGLSKGRNIGIKRALDTGAEYIQILDNDVIVASDIFMQMINVVQSDPRIGIVGPIIYYSEEPNTIAYAGRYINYWTGFVKTIGRGDIDHGQYSHIKDVDCATGGTMFISRKALQAAGLLDERFFFWFEDIDFCTRVIRSGFRVVFNPNAKVWVKKIKKEKASGNVETKEKVEISNYYFIRNRFIVMKKHCSIPQLVTSTLCFAVIDAPRFFIKYLMHYRSLTMLASSFKGIGNLVFRKVPK